MRSRLSIRPLLIGLVLFLCPLAFPQDAMQLFRKMQAALGGADKIASIQDFEEIVRADAWHDDGRPMGVVRKRVRFIRPNYLRIDQVGREDTYVLYFDGSSGWEILPDGRERGIRTRCAFLPSREIGFGFRGRSQPSRVQGNSIGELANICGRKAPSTNNQLP